MGRPRKDQTVIAQDSEVIAQEQEAVTVFDKIKALDEVDYGTASYNAVVQAKLTFTVDYTYEQRNEKVALAKELIDAIVEDLNKHSPHFKVHCQYLA